MDRAGRTEGTPTPEGDARLRSGALRVQAVLQRAAPPLLRVTAGMLWLSNVIWKVPPGFGGLRNFVAFGADHPVAPLYPWAVRTLILPNMGPFGWITLVVEVTLAALLLCGVFTRAAAAVGFLQSIAIGLSVANAPEEWYWAYALMAALHAAVWVTAAGRTWGVDSLLRAARPRRGLLLELST